MRNLFLAIWAKLAEAGVSSSVSQRTQVVMKAKENLTERDCQDIINRCEMTTYYLLN